MPSQFTIKILEVFSGYGSNPESSIKNPGIEDIRAVMASIDWRVFHEVSLTQENGDWISVSGNSQEDGFACVYHENDDDFFSDDAPKSIKHITDILISYFINDGKYKRENKFTSRLEEERQEEKKKKIQAFKYAKWKKKFYLEKEIERKTNIRNLIIALLIIGFLSFIIYYWYIDELKFIGHKTELIDATVIKTQMFHLGRGLLKEWVKYEYTWQNKNYTGYHISRGVRKQKSIGDRIRIKISIKNPNISKMVGVYSNTSKYKNQGSAGIKARSRQIEN